MISAELLEILILEECGEHEFRDFHFGFIPGRGTTMAATLARDIIFVQEEGLQSIHAFYMLKPPLMAYHIV